ncbi:hypothetical protein SAMD00023353_2100920 [Rosellinia necatrix]|uniref:Uncharacterized protein n=1 Tax=Rosellinia necatrix TaxID=77044 RepID=A0A1W2TFE9_ROSNE|nr:hypothetical protein SAMD00023353_2100920 [Rosellinia necatrix]
MLPGAPRAEDAPVGIVWRGALSLKKGLQPIEGDEQSQGKMPLIKTCDIPFSIHYSPFTIHHSSFAARRPPSTVAIRPTLFRRVSNCLARCATELARSASVTVVESVESENKASMGQWHLQQQPGDLDDQEGENLGEGFWPWS